MPLPDFRASACDQADGSSPPEGRMGRAFSRWFTADEVPLRTAPWGTQWGQLNRLLAVLVSCAPSRRGTGAWLRPATCLVHSAPSGAVPARSGAWVEDCYLVDSASSHMLVSKIKPCMSKYKHLYSETANGSLNQL